MAVRNTKMKVENNLEQQVSEIELLQSVYSKPGEFKFDDEEAFLSAKAFVNDLSLSYPKALSFTIHLLLEIEDDDENYPATVDICCRVENAYPTCLPEVNIRSENLSRKEQDRFNADLLAYMKTEIVLDEVCIYPLVEWIKQETSNYCLPPTVHQLSSTTKPLECGSNLENNQFCRMWLYMHHIYSKIKRRNILSLSKDYDLSGFCLPGKPGVVCIEGTVHNTNEFYALLRRWNWKSITCRKREVCAESSNNIDSQRKFSSFQELAFDVHGPRGNHLDLGQFKHYLAEHGLELMFRELFGVEGK